MYGSFIDPGLVIHLIKEVNETVSDNKTFLQEIKELVYTLEAETETVIDSIIVVGIKTPLDMASITL